MDISILRQIIQGGLDKMKEAGVVLIGGHSVEDKELKYGLSVTGFIHPDRILTKKNLKEGDRLILTKPLGTGIINTSIKGGLASPEIIETVTRLMATLNRDAALIMNDYPVHACTDITGFGLLGHLAEMIVDSPFGIRLSSKSIPIIPGTLDYAGMGLVPAGAYKNREFRECMVDFSPSVDRLVQDVLFDPQTSGGLLICVERDRADELLRELKKKGIKDAAIIGEVSTESKERIIVK
jgi:selenide,water dikinase